MSTKMMGGKGNIVSVLLLVAAVSVFAAEQAAVSAPNEGVKSDLWAKDIAVIYLVPSGRYDPDFWTSDTFRWLVACQDLRGKPQDFLFDGFLFLSPMAKSGGNMTSSLNSNPSTADDWDWVLTSWLEASSRLSDAVQQVSKALNVQDRKAKVILSVPYPDSRSTAFGPIHGEMLDLSKDEHRVRAAELFVDIALKRWDEYAKQGRLDSVKLAGFYWCREGIWKDFPSKTNYDPKVVQELTSYVHSKGLLTHWIPGLDCQTPDSKRIGLGCVTIQTNYQAPAEKNSPPRPLSIFDNTDAIVEKYGMNGVEMNMIIRENELNPRIYSPYQVWLANYDAALRLNWKRFSAITYFNAGEIPPSPRIPRHASIMTSCTSGSRAR